LTLIFWQKKKKATEVAVSSPTEEATATTQEKGQTH
jgi:hypothetical protein